jgi:hypothetical protein
MATSIRLDSLAFLSLGKVVGVGFPYHGLYTFGYDPQAKPIATVDTVDGEANIGHAPYINASFLSVTEESLPAYADDPANKRRWKAAARVPYRAGTMGLPGSPRYRWNINTGQYEWDGYWPKGGNSARVEPYYQGLAQSGWFYRAPSGATWHIELYVNALWSRANGLNATLTARRAVRFGATLEQQAVSALLADLGQSNTTVDNVDPANGQVILTAWSPKGDRALLLLGAWIAPPPAYSLSTFARLGLVELTLSEAQDGTITAEAELLYGRDAMIGTVGATFFDSYLGFPPYLVGDTGTFSSSASVTDRILGGWYTPDGTLEILKFSKTVQCDIEVTVYESSSPYSRTQITHCETSIAHTLTAGTRTLTETLAHEADCTVGYSSEPGPGNPKGVANFEGSISLNGQTLVTAGPTQLTKGSQIEETTNIFSRAYPEQISEERLKGDRGLATTLLAEWAFMSTGTHTNLDDLDYWLYEHVDDGPMKWQLCPVAETAGVIAHALSVEARFAGGLDPMIPNAVGAFLGFLPLGAVTAQNTHATRSGSGYMAARAVPPDDPDYEMSTRFPWMDKPLPWRSNGRLYYWAGPWSAYDPLDGTLHEPVQTDEEPPPTMTFV